MAAKHTGLLGAMTLVLSLILVMSLLFIAPAASAAAMRCPLGQFMPQDSLLDECRPCSMCPVNEIIRKPCTADTDTVCGPFYEFQNFNNFRGEAEVDLGKLMLASNSPDTDSEDEDILGDSEQEVNSKDAKGEKGSAVRSSQEQQWRELCYGLIGALVIVVFAAVLYILISQFLRHRRLHKNASPLSNEPDVTVYYRADGHAQEYQRVQSPPKRSSLAHIESQLEHNQRYRNFWERFMRPGSAHILGGNDYIVTFDNMRNQDVVDQRRLLPVRVSFPTEEEAALSPAGVHQRQQDENEPLGGAANVSLHSTDSGIVAGLGEHAHSSHV